MLSRCTAYVSRHAAARTSGGHHRMTNFDSVDYFTDPSLIPDPHPYFDHLRCQHPACCPINNGVLAVTGWEAANAVYKDVESYSSCVAGAGPFTPIPFVPEGDDTRATSEGT